MKKCHRCGETKPLDQFHLHVRSPDGRQHKCRTCACEVAREWRHKNTEREIENHRAYFQKNKASVTAKNAQWQRDNKDRLSEYGHKYRTENVPKELARAKRYRASHKSEAREYRREYRDANRERLRLWDANRRAAELRAKPKWASDFFIAEAYHLARKRSEVCGGEWHVDHIVPLRSPLVCGLHVEHNLQVIPGVENMSKSNRHWPDMP